MHFPCIQFAYVGSQCLISLPVTPHLIQSHKTRSSSLAQLVCTRAKASQQEEHNGSKMQEACTAISLACYAWCAHALTQAMCAGHLVDLFISKLCAADELWHAWFLVCLIQRGRE